MARTHRFLICFLIALLPITLVTPVFAKPWYCPWCKEKERPFYMDAHGKVTPPPKDIEKQQCDPIREKIIRHNQKPFVLRAFYVPYIGRLKEKHHQCLARIKEWKRDYLEAVELRGDPGFPKNRPPENLLELDF
jgi:hypothetical protein